MAIYPKWKQKLKEKSFSHNCLLCLHHVMKTSQGEHFIWKRQLSHCLSNCGCNNSGGSLSVVPGPQSCHHLELVRYTQFQSEAWGWGPGIEFNEPSRWYQWLLSVTKPLGLVRETLFKGSWTAIGPRLGPFPEQYYGNNMLRIFKLSVCQVSDHLCITLATLLERKYHFVLWRKEDSVLVIAGAAHKPWSPPGWVSLGHHNEAP